MPHTAPAQAARLLHHIPACCPADTLRSPPAASTRQALTNAADSTPLTHALRLAALHQLRDVVDAVLDHHRLLLLNLLASLARLQVVAAGGGGQERST